MKETGGGDGEACANREGELPRITKRHPHTSEYFLEKGMRTLRMVCLLRFEMRFTSSSYANSFLMTRARSFFAMVGFLSVSSSMLAQALLPPAASTAQVWVASWGCSQQIPEPQNALPPDDLRDATVRALLCRSGL